MFSKNYALRLPKTFFIENKILTANSLLRMSSSDTNLKPITMAYDMNNETADKKETSLIIMHGMLGSKQNWRGMGRAFGSKFKGRIFAVDARNHGDSPHSDDHSSAHMAEDVKEFMKQHEVDKSYVLGHSMGGRSMMYLALKYPHLVEKLIVVDISPISVPRTFVAFDGLFFALKNIQVPKELPAPDGRKLAGQQIADALGGEADTVNFILQNLRKRENGEFYWAPNLDAIHKNLRYFNKFIDQVAGYKAFEKPVCFICGLESNFVDPDHLPEIKKIFPNSEVHWLNAGHLVHLDKPHEFIDLVTKFLNS